MRAGGWLAEGRRLLKSGEQAQRCLPLMHRISTMSALALRTELAELIAKEKNAS